MNSGYSASGLLSKQFQKRHTLPNVANLVMPFAPDFPTCALVWPGNFYPFYKKTNYSFIGSLILSKAYYVPGPGLGTRDTGW